MLVSCDDAPIKAPMVEVSIGGDDAIAAAASSDGDPSAPDASLLREHADLPLAEVAAHMQRLAALVAEPAASLCEDDATHRRLVDHCDQVLYWALAEAHFPDDGSALAECDAVPTLMTLLRTGRGPLVLLALQTLAPLLRHRINCELFVRTPDALSLLAGVMGAFPNKEEIQAAAIAAALPAATRRLEPFLDSDVVGRCLAAMQRHPRSLPIQLAGCRLFAAVVALPRADPTDAPTAVLLVHVGAVVDFVVAALLAHPASSDVAAAAVTVLAATAARPENADVLLGTSALRALVVLLECGTHLPGVLAATLGAVANLAGGLDALQRRSVVLAVRRVMGRQADTHVLAACCGVAHVVATAGDAAVAATRNALHTAVAEREQAGEADPGRVAALDAAVADARVALAAASEEAEGLRAFVGAQLAQIVGVALDHFGDDDEVLRSAAETCLRSLTVNKWSRFM